MDTLKEMQVEEMNIVRQAIVLMGFGCESKHTIKEIKDLVWAKSS